MDKKQPTPARSSIDAQKLKHIPSSSKDATATNTPTRLRIIQNFRLIWLDANIDESNADFCHSIIQLRRNVNTIDTFTDADQCVDYLTDIKDEKAFMIVSGALGQHTVPLVHAMSQLNAIFVFCGNKARHEQWAKKWSKVQGVFTEIGPICEALKQAARQCDQDTISISFVSTSDASNQNLNQLDQSFMYTQILKEILFEIDYDEQSIKDLSDFCQEKYVDNNYELGMIADFRRNYRGQSPIWWYTCDCFLYSMLNRALRTQEVDTIIKMGFFIRDLHRHIEHLHSNLFPAEQVPFVVYRGQGLSREAFDKLMQTKGGLMSFNNFLSTSKDLEVSLAFATSTNPDCVGILFKMKIDPTISTAPFALVDGISYFETEQEILFSMHTVFRIGEIKKLDESKQLWQVELELTSDNDLLLSALTAFIREETEGRSEWSRLGRLLIKLGEFDKAKEVYQVLLDQRTSNDSDKGYYYHQLGVIKDNQGDYVGAISLYEKALEIFEKTLPPNHLSLPTSYNNIGLVYENMGEYSKALSYHEKALEIYQKTLPANHPSLASSYNNIGEAYRKMGEYSKALSFYVKALEIKEKTLPLNHPNLATSYNNIGLVYENMGEYSKALSSNEKALGIYQKTLPPNHPNLATSYNNIGEAYRKMGEYSKALSFYEKALEIYQKNLPPNHPSLATSYNNIGLVYYYIGDYSKALSFYEKAFEIFEKTLPSNHPNLASSYNNIGEAYRNMGEYSKALSVFEKALEIYQKTLPPNHPNLASSYNNIGLVYYNINEYLKALSVFEKALEIRQKTLASNHPDLAQSYNNMGEAYRNMGEYSKALSFYEKALEIYQKTLPQNHLWFPTSYNNIGLVYENMGEYSKALSSHEKALGIFEKTLPPNHPNLASSCNNIAEAYRNMGDYSKAVSFYEKALEINQKTLPPNHSNLATSYNDIGLMYYNMREYSKVLSVFEKALEILQHSLPPNHPHLEVVRRNIESVKKKM